MKLFLLFLLFNFAYFGETGEIGMEYEAIERGRDGKPCDCLWKFFGNIKFDNIEDLVKKIFKKWDINGDRCLSFDEFKQFYEDIGSPDIKPCTLKDIFRFFDR